jgi:hypothetical protein
MLNVYVMAGLRGKAVQIILTVLVRAEVKKPM